MRSLQSKRVVSVASAFLLSAVAFACGGESSGSAPPAAPSAPVATAAPPAIASAAPATPPAAPSAPASASAAPSAAAPAEDNSAQEDEDAASDLAEHDRHHHGGVPRFIAMAVESLGTTPEQHATIEGIQTNLTAKLEPVHTAEHKVLDLLATGVAAGKIDQAKVDAAIAQVGTAASKVHPAIVGALNQLHTALNEAERAALVDKVQAHWQVWHESNEPAESTDEHKRTHLDALAKDLSLTPEQVDKIRTALAAGPPKAEEHLDRDKVEAHLQAFAKAFESPTFDANALKPEGVNSHLAIWGTKRMAHFYEVVTPVLTPEQRTQLADRIRAHANHPAH